MNAVVFCLGRLSALGLSPERQFLNYAWPCLGNRYGHGQQVRPSHTEELERVIAGNIQPRRSLLRFVFPDAYRGISLAGGRLGVERWSHEAVEQYFIVDHNRHVSRALSKGVSHAVVELCMVYLGRVLEREALRCRVLLPDLGEWDVMNPLLLPISADGLVVVHGRTVVDILSPGTPL